MSCLEIFSKVSAHQIQGLMLHSGWSDYFAFLGLDGFKKLHEYRYIEESKNMRNIRRYFIEHYNGLPIDLKISGDITEYVPWTDANRFTISNTVRQMHIQRCLEGWVNWERDSKHLYENAYKELSDSGEIAGSNAIERLVTETDSELCYAENLLVSMESVDFSMNVIVLEQERIKREYLKKMEDFSLMEG